MPTKIGHFEILSEIAKSPFGGVYKANDPSGQTVALKAIQLSAFGDQSTELEKALLEEAESTKVLSNPNITAVLGAGEIEGQFCAAMDYIQGNSIATMLARKEGFSIWDLLDISRQVCSGLDYAHSQNAFHYSLEPSKIMCGWDGTVRILSFGVSSVGKFIQQGGIPLPSFAYYMSPEQLCGDPIDGRSNLFSLGAMFYEMVTDHRAFAGDDIESLRHSIVETSPVPPAQLNPKVHPLMSQLILKALDVDPAKRYQSGRELLDDLEKCKESRPQAAKAAAAPAKPVAANPVARAAAQAKFATSAPKNGGSIPAAPKQPAPPAVPPRASVSATPSPTPNKFNAAPAKAKAAAAGQSASSSSFSSPANFASAPASEFENDSEPAAPSAHMSSATVEPEIETFSNEDAAAGSKIVVDPMMAEGGPARSGTSFSDISELPPLKEVYVAPEPPPQVEPTPSKPAAKPVTMFDGDVQQPEEKPKVQPREIAQKAIKEVKSVPPQLMLYSIAGAAVIILIIAVGIMLHLRSSSDDDSGQAQPEPAAQAEQQTAQPVQPVQPAPVAAAPAPAATAQPDTAAPEPEAAEPERRETSSRKSRLNKKHGRTTAAPVVIPGQVVLESTPAGAQIQIDGQSDPSWVTPVQISSLQPGQHSIVVSKAGYGTDSRTITVQSGSTSDIIVHLSQLMAALSVTSSPAGAHVFIDGRDTGKVTPAQINVDKGQHIVLVRKMGYIDETASAQFLPGQTVALSPTLRNLGDTESIHTVGKMKRLFGRDHGQPGQAMLSVRTQPKGAQVAINQRMMDKDSPLEVMLDPGNYVVDITMSGYAPIHRVISADKDGKVVIDEVLRPQ